MSSLRGGSDARAGASTLGARVMERFVRPSVPPLWLGVVVAASFIAVETLVPYPLERFTDGRALALVYVVGVVVVAIV